MSPAVTLDQHPDGCDCGCCAGVGGHTRVEIDNRPGLSAIAYRAGTYADFRDAMIAALSSSQRPGLARLSTRQTTDFSIALIDACAVVLDVLTFYQERLAAEAYLRTARERFSVRELARLIGFELRPGVAASVDLAFTLDTAAGAPTQITIPVGLKVQSVPGPGEKVQVFETTENVEARPDWNAMKPRVARRHDLVDDKNELLPAYFFEGIATGLKQGDVVVLGPSGSDPIACTVASLRPASAARHTEVALKKLSTRLSFIAAKATVPLTPVNLASSFVAANFHSLKSSHELYAKASLAGIKAEEALLNIRAKIDPPPRVMTFRARAAVFGHNAPYFFSLTEDARKSFTDVDQTTGLPWNEVSINVFPGDTTSNDVPLDTTYPGIVLDSYVLLQAGQSWALHQVTEVSEVSQNVFTIAAKSTRITLQASPDTNFRIKNTTVHAQSTELNLARVRIEEAVSGTSLQLEGLIPGLYQGQSLIVCGELNDNRGNRACEDVVIKAVGYNSDDEGFTQVTFDEAGLKNTYVRDTVTIYGNVAAGTHGETVTDEVLGSGDAAQAYQRFNLKNKPLTYLSGARADGAVSTLELRVNDLLWHEADSLYARGPAERIFITQRDEEQNTTIIFGDGVNGARVPTGVENIRATYRKGIGAGGLVNAAQLTQLMTRPLGVKEVINPMPATGAQDPQSLEDARAGAPITVMTLGRIVSLRDYEDFARNFAGVAKALATWTSNGRSRGVIITVAGPDGNSILPRTPLFNALHGAIQNAGDPHVHFEIRNYEPRYFRIAGSVWADADHLPEKVAQAVEASFRNRFSFEARAFGQPAVPSEIIAAIQGVEGVIGVDLDSFYRWDASATLDERILAAPSTTQGPPRGAELLMLDPQPLSDLKVTQ